MKWNKVLCCISLSIFLKNCYIHTMRLLVVVVVVVVIRLNVVEAKWNKHTAYITEKSSDHSRKSTIIMVKRQQQQLCAAPVKFAFLSSFYKRSEVSHNPLFHLFFREEISKTKIENQLRPAFPENRYCQTTITHNEKKKNHFVSWSLSSSSLPKAAWIRHTRWQAI